MSEKSANNGDMPYRFAIVELKHLVTDAYQRPLTTFVDKIEKHFDPALVGTVCLSERSKTKFAVIDGQTRAEGMKRRGLSQVPAIVYEGLTREQEAELFSKFQTERRGMTSSSLFKAKVIAGDPVAVKINEVVEKAGFRVDQNTKSSPGNVNDAIAATAALQYVFNGATSRKATVDNGDADLLEDTLITIKSAWPKLPDTAKTALMIKGLGFFIARNPATGNPRTDEIDFDKLVAKLRKATPSDLARRAELLREGRGGMSGKAPSYMAEAIDAAFRKR